MQKRAVKHYSPEEYLALEEKAEFKSEYYQGEIFAMAGASANHNRIVGNLHANLHASLAPKDCEVFMSDLRVRVETHDLFTYPDVAIVCGGLEFYKNRDDTILNPFILFEVLSKSTEGYDHGKKFAFYRAIPGLKEYVLVDQYNIHIERFSLGDAGKWVLTEFYEKDERLTFDYLEVQIPLTAVYRRVDFGESVK